MIYVGWDKGSTQITQIPAWCSRRFVSDPIEHPMQMIHQLRRSCLLETDDANRGLGTDANRGLGTDANPAFSTSIYTER